jgi:hypothetical protein
MWLPVLLPVIGPMCTAHGKRLFKFGGYLPGISCNVRVLQEHERGKGRNRCKQLLDDWPPLAQMTDSESIVAPDSGLCC